MKSIRRFALASAALALGVPAFAQNVDRAQATPTGNLGFASQSSAVTAGAPKAQLYANGTYITQTGVGAAGADVSEIEPGLNLFGSNITASIPAYCADDFTVTAGETWTLSDLRWLGYQTNSPTSGTLTEGNYQLFDGPPNTGPNVLDGDQSTNVMSSAVWTGVYRVTSATLTSTARALIEATLDVSTAPALNAGSYWFSVGFLGSGTSGPWTPVTVPWTSADNAQQFWGGVWNITAGGQGAAPHAWVFWVDGTSSAGGGPNIYCTAGTNSLAGCVPTIGGPSNTASLSAGAGSFDVTCGPVPGGPQPSIIFYSTAGPQTPATVSPFGFLCVKPGPAFFRVPVPSLPGGAVGSCNGSYTYDFGNYLATQTVDPNLVSGAQVDMQAWYRDPGVAATAVFSNAMDFTLVP